MARPRKEPMTPEESAALIAKAQASSSKDGVPTGNGKVVVTKFQMGLPCDLLGSKFSFSASRNMSMEATPLGIIMRSAGSKRKIMVPWTNVKAAEFAWDGE